MRSLFFFRIYWLKQFYEYFYLSTYISFFLSVFVFYFLWTYFFYFLKKRTKKRNKMKKENSKNLNWVFEKKNFLHFYVFFEFVKFFLKKTKKFCLNQNTYIFLKKDNKINLKFKKRRRLDYELSTIFFKILWPWLEVKKQNMHEIVFTSFQESWNFFPFFVFRKTK